MEMIVSIDLSGSASPEKTGVAWFETTGDNLDFVGSRIGATDSELAELAEELVISGDLLVGMDAPLSYHPGGGFRASDEGLREKLEGHGEHPGIVMPPTASRMVYLTLRGVAVARTLALVSNAERIRIVEVHPGAALLLRKAPVDDVKQIKKSRLARLRLLNWLGGGGMIGLVESLATSDHVVAACAGALATWDWGRDRPPWIAPAAPPAHPFDFAG